MLDLPRPAFIQPWAGFLLGSLLSIAACGKAKPVWPQTLTEQTFDAEGMKNHDRREFRQLVEFCEHAHCGVVELSWWSVGAPSERICAVRLVQLGGEPLRFLRVEIPENRLELKLFVTLNNRGKDGLVQGRRLLGNGELLEP